MKLSKTTLLLVITGIFAVVVIALGMVRYQQIGQQEELSRELALAQQNLGRTQPEELSSRQAELEEKLNQTTSQFEAVKSVLSQPIGSIKATGILFEIAKAYNLEVASMTSSGATTGSLEGVACSVITLAVRVEGDVPDIVNFITKLNSFFATGVVKSVTITIPEDTSSEKASANFQLMVYTHGGE